MLDLRERLNDILKLAKEQLESSHARQKKYFDKKTKASRFSPGDKVLLLLPTDTNKLLVQWKERYDSITQWVLIITNSRTWRGEELHANLPKKYLSRDEETSSRVPEVSSQTRDDLNVPSCVVMVRTMATRQIIVIIKTF